MNQPRLLMINCDKLLEEVDTLQNTNLGYQKTIESNQKSIDVLQNINLGHQKTIEEKDNQIMQLNESNKALETERYCMAQ